MFLKQNLHLLSYLRAYKAPFSPPYSLLLTPYSLFLRAFGIFTLVESALQIGPFCTNKPNFRKSQMNVSDFITTDYEKRTLGRVGKTNPIQTQYKPNQTQLKPI
jgi:hypothetical protein